MTCRFNSQPLYVIVPYMNSCRWRSRLRLHKAFEKYVHDSGAVLYTVEVAFGDRPFDVTEADNPRHVQLRTFHEVWQKEASLNVCLSRLPADWEKVCWCDGDVTFARPDWVEEVKHLLEHYMVIQNFSFATDLSAKYEPIATHRGFMAAYTNGEFKSGRPYEQYHPGFSWSARREALESLGGLFDAGIAGSSDRHLAMALISDVHRSYPKGISPGYKQWLELYQKRALKLHKDVGYMDGLLLHGQHGDKRLRAYRSRWTILTHWQFDPNVHIYKDTQGLWALEESAIGLRDDIRRYMLSRREDQLAE